MRILVVENSWQVDVAITRLLKALGAKVSDPAAISPDAQPLVRELQPAGAALVDFKLRGGELAGGLIERLRELGIHHRDYGVHGIRAPVLELDGENLKTPCRSAYPHDFAPARIQQLRPAVNYGQVEEGSLNGTYELRVIRVVETCQ